MTPACMEKKMPGTPLWPAGSGSVFHPATAPRSASVPPRHCCAGDPHSPLHPLTSGQHLPAMDVSFCMGAHGGDPRELQAQFPCCSLPLSVPQSTFLRDNVLPSHSLTFSSLHPQVVLSLFHPPWLYE